MSGVTVVIPISPDRRIIDLKVLISEKREFGFPLPYRQNIVFMVQGDPSSFEPLADERTLAECGIKDTTELDLLLPPPDENLTQELYQLHRFAREGRIDNFREVFGLYFNENLNVGRMLLENEDNTAFINAIAPLITELIIDSPVRSVDVAIIAEMLKTNTTITRLTIRNNHHTVRAGEAALIADMLRVNTYITYINLSNNNFRVEGARSIADALRVNRTLTEIDLSSSVLMDEGVLAILDSLYQTNITKIDISSNTNFGAPRWKLNHLESYRPDIKVTH